MKTLRVLCLNNSSTNYFTCFLFFSIHLVAILLESNLSGLFSRYIVRPYKGPSVQHPSIQLLNKERWHTFEEIYKPRWKVKWMIAAVYVTSDVLQQIRNDNNRFLIFRPAASYNLQGNKSS